MRMKLDVKGVQVRVVITQIDQTAEAAATGQLLQAATREVLDLAVVQVLAEVRPDQHGRKATRGVLVPLAM